MEEESGERTDQPLLAGKIHQNNKRMLFLVVELSFMQELSILLDFKVTINIEYVSSNIVEI